MLSQIPVFAEDDTVEDILRSSFKQAAEVYDAMKKIEAGWANVEGQAAGRPGTDDNPADMKRYGKLMQEYEMLGGYETDVRIEKICKGMNISDEMRRSLFRLLSGGEKTRINLARILLRDCDILLLDEPTNHLDLASLSWLEQFMHEYHGTVVIISHDRVFLDNVVARIIEIDGGKVNFYSGNYTFFVHERQQRYLTQAEQYKQQQRKINQLEAAIKRQRVWANINPSNTGLAKRALAMEKRIEQMDKVEKPAATRKLAEDFNIGGNLAKAAVSFDMVYMLPLIILKVIYLVPLMFIWRVITEGGVEVEMTLTQLLTYTYVNALLADMLIVKTYMTDWDFDSKSTALFTRPMSVFGQVISRTVGEWVPTLLLFSLPMAIAAPFFGIQIVPHTLWVIPSLILCVSLGFALEFIFFCVTLRVRNVSWLTQVIRSAIVSFFSGTVIPFRILPFGLDRWMSYQPFGSLGGAPLSLYVGVAVPVRVIAAQIVWNVFFWCLAIWWFKKSKERMVSFGG